MACVINEAPLCISVKMDGDKPSIHLKGHADSSTISDVVKILDQVTSEHENCVSLDMGEVISMDTVAVKELMKKATMLRNRQHRLHLKCASDAVLEIFDRLLISDAFCIETCSGKCNSHSCGIAKKSWEMDVFTLPCQLISCHNARERVDKVAEAVGFNKCSRNDIRIAVGEAVSNAIRYCECEEEDATFTVSCVATPEKLCITVSDNGPGFDPTDIPAFENSLLMEHGRGIFCMGAVMDDVTFQFAQGTTVRMVKHAN